MNEIVKIVITALTSAVVSGMIVYLKSVRGQIKALKDGLLSLLRAEIIRSHDKYTDCGYCPIYAKEAAEKVYMAYHSLGGNGTVTTLYTELMNLTERRKNSEN